MPRIAISTSNSSTCRCVCNLMQHARSWFCNAAQRRSSFLKIIYIMRCYADRKPEVFWQNINSTTFLLPLGGKTSLASISLSLLKGREGHRHRGIAAASVAAKNQTTAGFRLRLESQRLHTAHHTGFYWPFSITPVTQDWVYRSTSFSWKGQSRLWGQEKLKWNNQWNGAKYNALLTECKSWFNYEWFVWFTVTSGLIWEALFLHFCVAEP